MPVSKTYTIGQLASACGVPVSTLRYYERAGLLAPPTRSVGHYRLYDQVSEERLHFIRAAQSVGFTLEDVKQLLDYRDRRTAPCREVQGIIEQRMTQLTERLKHLKSLQKELRRALTECQTDEASGRCVVIDSLTSKSKS